jgi:hypothetical protein
MREADKAKRKPIETLRRTSIRREIANSGSAREEIKRNLGQGFRRETLEGQNPREEPVIVGLNPRSVTRDFRKGQNPETEA